MMSGEILSLSLYKLSLGGETYRDMPSAIGLFCTSAPHVTFMRFFFFFLISIPVRLNVPAYS
jgi:hypothetical protein